MQEVGLAHFNSIIEIEGTTTYFESTFQVNYTVRVRFLK